MSQWPSIPYFVVLPVLDTRQGESVAEAQHAQRLYYCMFVLELHWCSMSPKSHQFRSVSH